MRVRLAPMTAKLHLQSLYSWCERDGLPLPDVTDIDAKQRRRLSSLAKLSLAARVGLAAHCDLSRADHILWCSSFGDEHKTLHILQDIARDEAPSPTAFATSVHNATAGLYGMLYHDDVPTTSLNVGHSEFTAALLYAHALLQTQAATQVLVVCADEPLPALYGQHDMQHDMQHAYAMACVLVPVDAHHLANLSVQSADEAATAAHTPQALCFAHFWQQDIPSLHLDTWQLCKA